MLLAKMLAVIEDLNTRVAERGEVIWLIAIALLTRKNLFILGGTGQAKSYVINLFCKCITNAKLFIRLLTKQTDEESLFGRLDLKGYIDGNPRMIITGKIPDANIVFLDEIFKSNEGLLNSLLTATNEHRYTNEGETVDILVESFMSASNEIPDFNNPEDEILRPLFDRLEIKVFTQDIESREERLRMLARKQSQTEEQITATITLEELHAMQKEVAAVIVPENINVLMDDIMCDLRRRGIHVSDRKYFNYYPLVQSEAWLNGRNIVEAADLTVLKCYLWTKPEEIITIQQVLEQYCVNPVQKQLHEIELMAADSHDEFKANADTKSTRALMKLRGEFLRLYSLLMQIESSTLDTTNKSALANTINNLEKMSETAHKKCNFTYAPLSELFALQGGRI